MKFAELGSDVIGYLLRYMDFKEAYNLATTQKGCYTLFLKLLPDLAISSETIKNEVAKENQQDYQKYLFIWIKLMGNCLTQLHLNNIPDQMLIKLNNLLVKENITSIISLDLNTIEKSDDFDSKTSDKDTIAKVNEALKSILGKSSNLTYLDLSGRVELEDNTLKSIEKLTNLKNLNLNRCEELSNLTLGKIAESAKNITNLEIAFCTNVTNAEIFTSLKKLVHINLNGCGQFNDEMIYQLALKNNIEYLYLSSMHDITLQSIENVFENNKNLNTFIMNYCNALEDIEVQNLALKILKNLKKLDINNKIYKI